MAGNRPKSGKSRAEAISASTLVNKIFILLTYNFTPNRALRPLLSDDLSRRIKRRRSGYTLDTRFLEVCSLSLIHCTDPCVYQRDGLCELVRAGSWGWPGHGCVNFVPVVSQPLQQGRQGLPDVGHPDELQPLGHHQLPLGALGDQTLGKAQPPHLGQPLPQGVHGPELSS